MSDSLWPACCSPVPMYVYWPLWSSRASPVIVLTRPVRSAYRFCAAVRFAAEIFGKLAALNIAFAGSLVIRPNAILGVRFEFFIHTEYRVADAPIVTLCAPFSHVTLSSNSSEVALRDCGEGALPGDVS